MMTAEMTDWRAYYAEQRNEERDRIAEAEKERRAIYEELPDIDEEF